MEELNVNYPDPGICTKTSQIQLAFGLWTSMPLVAVGFLFGFGVVLYPQLNEPYSKLSLTSDDIFWSKTAIPIAMPIGSIIAGLVMDWCGRRLALVLSQLPMLGGWFYTAFALTGNELITGRLMNGLGFGMSIPSTKVYATEITLPNMRGVIGVFPNVAVLIGLLTEATFGIYFHWRILCLINGAFSTILLLSLFCVPESPYYKLLIDEMDEVKYNLTRLRARDYNVDVEIEDMVEFKQFNNICRLSLFNQLKRLLEPSAYKPFCVLIIFFSFTQLAGVSFMAFWTVEIIMETNTSVSAAVGHVILNVTRFIGGIASIILIYNVGRRILSIVSGLGLGISFLALGIYEHAIAAMTILPQLCMTSYMFFASLGYNSIPVLLMSEVYPLQIRGLFVGMTILITNVMLFLTAELYPIMTQAIRLTGTVTLCGLFGLLGSVYLFFFMPETKDLTLIEIEEYYSGLRPSLISQRRLLATYKLQASIDRWKTIRSPSLISVVSFATNSKRRLEEKRKIKLTKEKYGIFDPPDEQEDRVVRFKDQPPAEVDIKKYVTKWKKMVKDKRINEQKTTLNVKSCI